MQSGHLEAAVPREAPHWADHTYSQKPSMTPLSSRVAASGSRRTMIDGRMTHPECGGQHSAQTPETRACGLRMYACERVVDVGV